jgi:integrase
MDKKNFLYKNFSYKITIGNRNYLEWYKDYRLVRNQVRTRIYKGFSVSNDIDVLQKVAEAYFDKYIFDVNEQNTVKPPNKLFKYLEDNRYRYRPKTYISFYSIVKKYSLWCEKNKISVDTITPVQAQKYISECINTGTSNTTASNYNLVLITLYTGLQKMKVIDNNSFQCIPKMKRNSKSLQHFSRAHIQAITDYCKVHNAQLLIAIKLLYSCYIRPGEMLMLQLYDINLEDQYIQIDAKIAKNKKTQKVKIPNSLIEDLQFIKRWPLHYYLLGSGGLPGEAPISPNMLNKQHCKMLKELKIKGNYAFYSWKHTGVIQAVRNGINMKTLQLQLRHHSLDMVNEYLKNLGIMDDVDLDNKIPTL